MPDRFVTLTHGRYGLRAGARVRVLGPGDPIEGHCVDAQRADALVEHGLAEWQEDKEPRKTRAKAKPEPELEPVEAEPVEAPEEPVVIAEDAISEGVIDG